MAGEKGDTQAALTQNMQDVPFYRVRIRNIAIPSAKPLFLPSGLTVNRGKDYAERNGE